MVEREKTPIQKQQEKELEKIEICMEIWKTAKEELYLSMRFFDVILNRMTCTPNANMHGVGTDGTFVYFSSDAVISLFQNNRVKINRMYLHMIFHCLFLHFHMPGMAEKQREYWNLACDIVVESILDSLNFRSVRSYVPPYRKNLYKKLREEHKVLTAKGVYFSLLSMEFTDEEFRKMQAEFRQKWKHLGKIRQKMSGKYWNK